MTTGGAVRKHRKTKRKTTSHRKPAKKRVKKRSTKRSTKDYTMEKLRKMASRSGVKQSSKGVLLKKASLKAKLRRAGVLKK